jgi:anthranilate phosphoribosyltransferase
MAHEQGGSEAGTGGSAALMARLRKQPMPTVPGQQSLADGRAASPSGRDDLPAGIRAVLMRVATGDDVASFAFADAFLAIGELSAPIRDVVLGSLMTTVMARGPLADDVEALLRGALALDDHTSAEVISGSDRPVVLLAGSGKKGVRTLNVSTPAALVAAAGGARVIKVGSAATSSALGSRDLVRALGLRERRTADSVRADLAASGFAFVAIEPEIPALDGLYGGRFHVPNPFSFGLAPLASPVRGDVTLFGLSHPRVDVAARVLSRFGMDRVDVLSTRLPSGHYLDEIGHAGELRWCRVRDGDVGPVEVEPAGAPLGARLPAAVPSPHSPAEAIERTAELLAGGGLDTYRALVMLNAAHLLVLSGVTASLAKGTAVAEDILRSGMTLARIPIAHRTERSA